MKVAFVGFKRLQPQKNELERLIVQYGHEVVQDTGLADVVLVPHHKDTLFPKQKPWIAVWVKGCTARFQYFALLANKPREIIFACDPKDIEKNQGAVLSATLEKICKRM